MRATINYGLTRPLYRLENPYFQRVTVTKENDFNELTNKILGIIVNIIILTFALFTIYLYCSKHAYYGLDKWIFSDQMRKFTPALFNLYDSSLSSSLNNLNSSYFSQELPIFYSFIYNIFSFFSDPIVFAKTSPYLIFSLFATIMGCNGAKIAGKSGFISSFLFTISAPIFLKNMVGTMPQAFAYPLAALVIYGVLNKNNYYIIFATILAAGIYPPVAIFSLLLLLIFNLIPKTIPELSFPDKKNRKILKISACFFLTSIIFLTSYNTIWQQTSDYHYGIIALIFQNSTEIFGERLAPLALAILPSLLVTLAVVDNRVQRLLVSMLALIILLSFISNPNLKGQVAESYFKIFAILLIPCLIKLSLMGLKFAKIEEDYTKVSLYLFAILVIICLRPNPINYNEGLDIKIQKKQRAIYEFIQNLPQDTIIAGVPDEKIGIVDNIPYLTKHNVFLTGDFNFKTEETKAIARQKLLDFFAAYYASDIKEIQIFQKQWHINYILVNLSDFKGKNFTYLDDKLNINSNIEQIFKDNLKTSNHFVLLDLLAKSTIFKKDNIYLLDLKTINLNANSPKDPTSSNIPAQMHQLQRTSGQLPPNLP